MGYGRRRLERSMAVAPRRRGTVVEAHMSRLALWVPGCWMRWLSVVRRGRVRCVWYTVGTMAGGVRSSNIFLSFYGRVPVRIRKVGRMCRRGRLLLEPRLLLSIVILHWSVRLLVMMATVSLRMLVLVLLGLMRERLGGRGRLVGTRPRRITLVWARTGLVMVAVRLRVDGRRRRCRCHGSWRSRRM